MSDKELQLKRAKSALISRDYETATRIYKALIREDYKDVSLKIELGNLYVKSGQDTSALVCFEEIEKIMLSSDNQDFSYATDVYLSLGGIYRRLGKYEESIEVLEKAMDIGEKDIQISYNLGFTYRQMGKYDSAIECFQRVVDKNPRDVLAFNHLGAIYALQNNHEKAITTYQHGLKLDPNHPVLQLNIAKSLEEVGEIKKALSFYEGALRSKPGWTEAIEGYSDLLLKDNQVREADDVVSRALKINPDDIKMHTAMGKIYNRKSVFDDAEKEFKKALLKNEEYSPALSGLAFSQVKQGKNSEAVVTIQKAQKSNPNDAEILKQSAHIYLSANKLEEAYNQISQLLDKNQDDIETVNLLGQYYICSGKEDKIESCFDRIEQLQPNYLDVYKDWGERFLQVGDEKNAEDYLKVAVHENKNDANAMLSLATLYDRQGRTDDALGILYDAGKVDEHNTATKRAAEKIERRRKLFPNRNKTPQTPVPIESNEVDDFDKFEKLVESTSSESDIRESSSYNPLVAEEEKVESNSEIPIDFMSETDDSDIEAPIDFEKDDDSSIDLEQFGSEKLSGDTDDLVSIDEIMSGDRDLDSTKPEDDLIDFDEPVDEDDEEPIVEKMPDGSEELNAIQNAPDYPELKFEEEYVRPMREFNVKKPNLFKDEDLGNPLDDESPIVLSDDEEQQLEQRKYDSRHKPRPISDNDYLSIERQLQRVANDVDNAVYTANQARRAAQFAEDNAVDAERRLKRSFDDKLEDMLEEKFKEKLDEKIEEKIKEKIGDDLNSKISETIENFVVAPEGDEETNKIADEIIDDFNSQNEEEVELINEDEFINESENKTDDSEKVDNDLPPDDIEFETPSIDVPENALDLVSNDIFEEDSPVRQAQKTVEAESMLKKAVSMLPSIVKAIEDKSVVEEFSTSLDMFKKLREMLEYLPPAKKKQFMTSRARLMLDYVIAKLSGKPGLFATVTALLKTGVMPESHSVTDEVTSDLSVYNSNDEEIITLVGNVFENLRKLCENLQDDYLRDAIDSEILELLEKIREEL